MPPPTWLEIAKGPILRFALAIMLLGLARLIVLAGWGMVSAVRRGGHRRVAYLQVLKETITWLLPLHRLHRTRPLYSYASFIFHLGLIFTMLFLQNHIDMLRASLGLGWPPLPRLILDLLTLAGIITGVSLFLHRLYVRSARSLSGVMDYVILLLLLNLLISGYLAGRPWNPIAYDRLMLFHTLNGLVVITMMPFTKIAHCVLFPLTRLASELAWQLTPQGGADVVKTLYGPEGRKI